MARASAEAWRSLLAQYAGDIPVNFLVDWIDEESGGLPCARGMCTDDQGQTCGPNNPNGCTSCDSPNAVFNREAGIFQTDHPGDDQYGATSSQLRVACAGTTSTQIRPMTAGEKQLQVQAGINYVQAQRSVVESVLASIGAQWPETSADFWMLVKSRHGLQTIATELLPVVARTLGRAPVNWIEFVNTYVKLPAGAIPASLQPWFFASSNHGRRNRLDDVIANAEAAGRNAGPRISGQGVPAATTETSTMSPVSKFFAGFFAVLGAAGAGWLIWRASKHVAHRPGWWGRRRRHRDLGAVDERLINRIAQALSYDVPVNEIHDQLVDEGHSEEDVYLAYKAAKQHLKHMTEPLPEWVKPDPEAKGLGARRYVRRARLAA